jgi:pyridoxamine 5'-phosphate oxidase
VKLHATMNHPANLGELVWTRLAQAANDVQHPMRLVTLATVDGSGQPSARTMVIRGADRASSRIWLHTDRRSDKVTHLHHNPSVCVTVFDGDERVQLRLFGRASLHNRDTVADHHWQQVLLSMRHAYGLPEPHGTPKQELPDTDPRIQQLWSHQRSREIAQDRAHFTVIQIAASHLEWLHLSDGEMHTVMLYGSQNWETPASAVAPQP